MRINLIIVIPLAMEPEDAINKQLALVLWAKDKDGEDDVVVFPGTLIHKNGNYYFKREQDGKAPKLHNEWIPRIKEVPEELKETLCNCDYQLSLTVEDINENEPGFESFGLKWPGS